MEKNHFKLARTEYNKNGFQSVKMVSDLTGVSKSLIDDLEANVGPKRDVGYSKICILAEHYGVTSDYLLGLSDFPSTDYDLSAAHFCTGLSLEAINSIKYHSSNDEVDPGIDMLNLVIQNNDFWELLFSLDQLARSVGNIWAKVSFPDSKIPFRENPILAAKADYLQTTEDFSKMVNSLLHYQDIMKKAQQSEDRWFCGQLHQIQNIDDLSKPGDRDTDK